MKILVTGGGSGGHITPVLAVASEIKKLDSNNKIIFVGQKGDELSRLASKDPVIDEYYEVKAGKFRRYNGRGLKQLLYFQTVILNIKDVFNLILGIFQSYKLLGKIRPNVIFTRGSFVSVPICLAARLRKIPYITHDSDSIPSLTNRIIGGGATYNLTAMPEELYGYPREKTKNMGIPLNNKFVQVTSKLKENYRKELNINAKAKVVLVVGGGQGAEQLNRAMLEVAHHLLEQYKDLYIINIAGIRNEQEVRGKYEDILNNELMSRVIIIGFTDEVYKYSASADIIVTRAGATNLAEFAVQNKACIIVPGTHLTSGHQIKNAKYIAGHNAAVLISGEDLDKDSNKLAKVINDLFKDKKKIQNLEQRIAEYAKPGASKNIADLVLKAGSLNEK